MPIGGSSDFLALAEQEAADLREALIEATRQLDMHAKAICDAYEYMKRQDYGAAMIRLRTTGVLP